MGPDNGPEPPDMTATGGEWWHAIAGQWELDLHEVALVRRVVAIADRIERLEAVVAAEGDLVSAGTGPRGTPRWPRSGSPRLS